MSRHVAVWRYRYLPPNVRVWVTRYDYVILWSTRNGFTFRGVSRPFLADDGDGQREQVFTTIWEHNIKRKPPTNGQNERCHGSDSWLSEAYPNLSEFLTAAAFEDTKERREAPTVTFWAASGQWKVSVRDKSEGLVLWLSAASLLELMQMLDLLVLDETAPWRHDEYAHPRDGKRVQRK